MPCLESFQYRAMAKENLVKKKLFLVQGDVNDPYPRRVTVL